MTPTLTTPFRDVLFGPRDVTLTRKGEVMYVRPVHELGPYPERLTDRLEKWAVEKPDQPFMSQRNAKGEWETLTYSQFRTKARKVAQALLDRPHVNRERPVGVLSGNDLDHAVIAFACYYAGVIYAPISTAYSLVSSDHGKLRYIFDLLTPGLVFVSEGEPYKKAIEAVLPPDAELVIAGDPGGLRHTPWSKLVETQETPAVEKSHLSVTPDTVAKLLFTSGSTGTPKGVMNTQRMLTACQEIIVNTLRFVKEEPPVIVDWLPWNHTFGGNHDVGFIVYNGGSFYIDEGRPTPAGMAATVRNLKDVGPNIYLNVPKGFDALIPYLQQDREFRERFYSRVKLLYYAGAGLLQPVWDELDRLALETVGERIIMFTGLGATETGPSGFFPGKDLRRAGEIGLPPPGVVVKLVPSGGKLEARLSGPGMTPGYWRQPELTAKAYDEEGFYKLGDALRFVDPNDVTKGFMFDGRIVEDFKLSTGTFVSAGPMRAHFLVHCAPYIQEAVIAGHDRDFVSVLIFPALDACRALTTLPPSASAQEIVSHPLVRDTYQRLLDEAAVHSTGSSNRLARAVLLTEPPSIDKSEVTDKGSINQGAVLRNRAAIVEDLYSTNPSPAVISLSKGSK